MTEIANGGVQEIAVLICHLTYVSGSWSKKTLFSRTALFVRRL